MPELIRQQRLYLAQPPLYALVRGKRSVYVLDDEEMRTQLLGSALTRFRLVLRDEAGQEHQRLDERETSRLADTMRRTDADRLRRAGPAWARAVCMGWAVP